MSKWCGVEVTLKRRFGGHGGISTEWEISFQNLHHCHDEMRKDVLAMIASLPDYPGITIVRDCGFIALPEFSWRPQVGAVVQAYAEMEPELLQGALRFISHEGQQAQEVCKTVTREEGRLLSVHALDNSESRLFVAEGLTWEVFWRKHKGVWGAEGASVYRVLDPDNRAPLSTDQLKELACTEDGFLLSKGRTTDRQLWQLRRHILDGKAYDIHWLAQDPGPDADPLIYLKWTLDWVMMPPGKLSKLKLPEDW